MPEGNDHIKITVSQPRVQFVADGFQTYFPFVFQVLRKTDLHVYIGDQLLPPNYIVSGVGDTSGGAVVLAEAPSAGTIVTLVRSTPIQRLSDFQQSGLLQAKVLNDELDLLTVALQDVAEDVRRGVKLAVIDSDANLTLPDKGVRANGVLGFDANGDATVFPSAAPQGEAITPGGADTQVQFNDGGEFAGTSGLTYAKSTSTLSIVGSVRSDAIDERTTGAGVTVEGVLVNDGLIDGRDISADGAKLDGIEAGADVTDATKVSAAGAVLKSDTSTLAMQFVIDDDTMASATNSTLATSASIKAYVDGSALADGNRGDITVSGAASLMTLDNNVVTNAKAADMAQGRMKGRITAGIGDPEDLTADEVRAVVNLYSRSEIDALTWDASDIASGTFSDGRIAATNVTQHQGAIDHDALTNFVANEHIDWTSTTENLSTSGTGATGDLTVTGNLMVTGTVDGRDVAADGAKLDALHSYARVSTVADMSALDGAAHPAGSIALVDRYAVSNDGGGGWFVARDSGDAVDGGFVFAHQSGGPLRWHRTLMGEGTCSVAHFGARGDGVTDDTAAIQAALDSGVGRVVLPPGTYKVTSSLVPSEHQIVEGLNGWENVEIAATSVSGGIIDPNGSYLDAFKTRIQIKNLKLSGSADYGIRLINCTSANIENIRFVFNDTDGVSNLTYDCVYMGNSWEARISFISAYVSSALVKPARSVIWLDGAINGVLADTIRTTAATRYGIVLSNTDAGGTEVPTAVTINNATLQRQQIGVYAKRCRAVNASGLYFEKTQIPIRLGSDDSSTDRCTGFGVLGAFFVVMDGTSYGWSNNTTAAIEAIRAHGCTFTACNFSDYGSGASKQMLYVKRCWGLRIDGPTRFNFAMSDMRPAISYDAAWDPSSTFTVSGNGAKGGQTINTGLSTEYGLAAPVSGTHNVGDRVINAAPSAGSVEGWVCTASGAPGSWATFGQVGT